MCFLLSCCRLFITHLSGESCSLLAVLSPPLSCKFHFWHPPDCRGLSLDRNRLLFLGFFLSFFCLSPLPHPFLNNKAPLYQKPQWVYLEVGAIYRNLAYQELTLGRLLTRSVSNAFIKMMMLATTDQKIYYEGVEQAKSALCTNGAQKHCGSTWDELMETNAVSFFLYECSN